MALLLNCELISRVILCLVSVFPDIVKDCPKIRNLLKIFLRSFENVGPDDKTECAFNHTVLTTNSLLHLFGNRSHVCRNRETQPCPRPLTMANNELKFLYSMQCSADSKHTTLVLTPKNLVKDQLYSCISDYRSQTDIEIDKNLATKAQK